MELRRTLAAAVSAVGLAVLAVPAEAVVERFTITFTELNSSGISGSGMLFHDTTANTLRVMYTATGLDAGMHPQHIHGLLASGPGSAPSDSVTPTLALDSDGDGFLETVEGVPAYGDVLLSLFNVPGDMSTFPVTGASGVLNYDTTFDLSDSSVFTPSPATGTVYTAPDLFPLAFREIVIHGSDVAAGVGGGMFEIDGTQGDGFIPLLPVAAAEIEPIPLPAAIWPMLAAGGLMVAVGRRRRHD